jgi:hypothetical protein
MPRFARGLIIFTASAATPAAAQLPYEPMPVAAEAPKAGAGPGAQAASESTDFRMPRATLRQAADPIPAGMVAAMPLNDRLTMGVGRFSVLEEPRVRTNTEPAHRAAEVRRRESGIAAVGISLNF